MNARSTPRVVVWPMESSPQGPGRPVQIGSSDVGRAECWDDVDTLLARAGLPPDTPVAWRGESADVWE